MRPGKAEYDGVVLMKNSNDEQPHTIIARLQAELALEREKVKEVRRELAEESKRLRRCEWKFHEGEGGGFERVAG